MSKSSGKIRAIRESLGLSTTQLAHRLGVAQSTVVRMEQAEERGAISLETLGRAASALGCELKYSLKPKTVRGLAKPGTAGLKRMSFNRGRRGGVGQALQREALDAARSLSGTERLKRALELSDLAKALTDVRKSSR